MKLMGVDEDGHQVACAADEDDEEFERKVMALTAAGNCIGCGACRRVCSKGCQTHVPAGHIADAA
jgi:Nif-specific ferredoxin III